MATKTKPRPVVKASASVKTASAARPSAAKGPVAVVATTANELPRTPPATTEEFVLHIRLIGKRLDEHVGFMCTAEKLVGTSAEAKCKALSQFYARLHAFEHELG